AFQPGLAHRTILHLDSDDVVAVLVKEMDLLVLTPELGFGGHKLPARRPVQSNGFILEELALLFLFLPDPINFGLLLVLGPGIGLIQVSFYVNDYRAESRDGDGLE